jgi:hypothetical protein
MKKLSKIIMVLALALGIGLLATGAWAYSIAGDPGSTIGYPTYATYGIDVYNFTPGTNSGAIGFSLYTNFPQAGESVPSGPYTWNTRPADVFITESYSGPANGNVRTNYEWVIPLVNHDSFIAGTMYAVGSSLISNSFDPSPGGFYNYNPGVKVAINTIGSNYGWSQFDGGTVTWNALASPGLPDYRIDVLGLGTTQGGIYQDDPHGTFTFMWGTATCANNVITGTVPVPVPPSALLLGSGILGLVGLRWSRKKSS